MKGDEYQVFIYGPGQNHADPLAQGVTFYVKGYSPGTQNMRYLGPDGVWCPLTEGTVVDEPSWRLPDAAYEALVEAIHEREGARLRPATEALVLREWLASERERVDRLLPRYGLELG